MTVTKQKAVKQAQGQVKRVKEHAAEEPPKKFNLASLPAVILLNIAKTLWSSDLDRLSSLHPRLAKVLLPAYVHCCEEELEITPDGPEDAKNELHAQKYEAFAEFLTKLLEQSGRGISPVKPEHVLEWIMAHPIFHLKIHFTEMEENECSYEIDLDEAMLVEALEEEVEEDLKERKKEALRYAKHHWDDPRIKRTHQRSEEHAVEYFSTADVRIEGSNGEVLEEWKGMEMSIVEGGDPLWMDDEYLY